MIWNLEIKPLDLLLLRIFEQMKYHVFFHRSSHTLINMHTRYSGGCDVSPSLPTKGRGLYFPSYLQLGLELSPLWEFPWGEGSHPHRLHQYWGSWLGEGGWGSWKSWPLWPQFKLSLKAHQLQSSPHETDWGPVAAESQPSLSGSLHSLVLGFQWTPFMQISVSVSMFWGIWFKTNEYM